jgi:type II secretory pathway pseudopilin PulG
VINSSSKQPGLSLSREAQPKLSRTARMRRLGSGDVDLLENAALGLPKRDSVNNAIKNNRGFILVEALISLALLGLIATAFLGGLSTSSKALMLADERRMAKILAEHQMEYIMYQGYASSYTPEPVSSEYPNYTVTITTGVLPSRDSNIQEIKITVSHNGKPIILADNCTLKDYRSN